MQIEFGGCLEVPQHSHWQATFSVITFDNPSYPLVSWAHAKAHRGHGRRRHLQKEHLH